jgi:WD40 repeat protein
MRTLATDRGSFQGVAYDPDGRFLVSLNSYNRVQFWDLSAFKVRIAFPLPKLGTAWTGAFSNWGGTFSLCGNLLPLLWCVWDLSHARELVRRLEAGCEPLPPQARSDSPCRRILPEVPPYTNTLGIATDGRTLVGATHRGGQPGVSQVRIWDLQGRFQRQFDATVEIWHGGGFALARDGRTLAVPVRVPGQVALLLDLASGEEVCRLQHTDRVRAAVFSPDGRHLLTVAGRTVWLWDTTAAGKPLERFPAFARQAQAPAFHPGGQLLGAAGRDGKVRLWRLSDGAQVACLDWQIGAVHGLAFSPEGATAAAAGHKGMIVVWDLD